jgi:hypothetical protein
LYNYSSTEITSSFSSHGGTYSLYVYSPVAGGVLEKFALRFTLRTSPINQDSDGDGLTDSEEVSYGTDAWITDPNRADTDGDSWSDGYEIKTRGTNPLSVDTDQDGVRDNVDLDPLRNLLVGVTVKQIHHGAGPWCSPELVGLIRINNDYTWVSKHESARLDPFTSWSCPLFIPTTQYSTASFYYTYYADVPDDTSSVALRATAWAINPGRGDDILVDQLVFYPLNSGTWSFNLWNGNSWYSFDIWTYALPKAQTLLITDGNATATASNGQTRLTGQDRSFVLALDLTSSYGPLTSGVNTIIVPRSIFLESKLKKDFDAGAYWPLSDATFYGEDLGRADVSDGIAGIIAKTLSGSDANNVLDRLLRNATNAKVYGYIDITWYSILSNLPADVVKILPWAGVWNGPTGAMPADFWQKIGAAASTVVNTLVYVGQLIYKGLVAIGSFLANLGEAIWAWGMRVLGTVWNAAVAVAQRTAALLDVVVSVVKDLMIRTLKIAISALLDGLTTLYRGTIGPVVSDLISLLTNPDPARVAIIIGSLVTRILELALLLALIPIAIRAAELALAAATLGVGYLVTKFSAKVVAEFAVKTLVATALSLAIAAIFGDVLESVGWVQQGVVDLLKAAGLTVAYSAAASSIAIKFYKAIHDNALGRRSPILRWIGVGLSLLSLAFLILGTVGLKGVALFAVDIAGMFLATGGFCFYIYESAKGEQRAADLLSSIGVYFEKFVSYGSPFVATAKAIDHGAQGLFG